MEDRLGDKNERVGDNLLLVIFFFFLYNINNTRSKVFSLERLWIKLLVLKGFGLVGLVYNKGYRFKGGLGEGVKVIIWISVGIFSPHQPD